MYLEVFVDKNTNKIIIKTDDPSIRYLLQATREETKYLPWKRQWGTQKITTRLYDRKKKLPNNIEAFEVGLGWAGYIINMFRPYMSSEQYNNLLTDAIYSETHRDIPFRELRNYQNDDILHVLKYRRGLLSCYTSYGVQILENQYIMKESKLKNLTKEQLEKYRSSGLSSRQIAKKLNVGKSTVLRRARELNVKMESVRNYSKDKYFDIHVFDTIDTEEKAYWLGFLYADGCIRQNSNHGSNCIILELKSTDYSHILKFKSFLKDNRDNSVIKNKIKYKDGTRCESSRYSVFNKHIVEMLVSFGCTQNKSLSLCFPDMSIFKEESFVIDFIRGYIDGDGCLSMVKGNNRLRVSLVGTLSFINGVINIFPEFCKAGEHHSIYQSSCCGDKADLVAHKLYGNATVYLDRKYNKYATLCRLYNASEKLGNIGEGCDANTEITSEITKGSEES